jgi:hypothetical protein
MNDDLNSSCKLVEHASIHSPYLDPKEIKASDCKIVK